MYTTQAAGEVRNVSIRVAFLQLQRTVTPALAFCYGHALQLNWAV